MAVSLRNKLPTETESSFGSTLSPTVSWVASDASRSFEVGGQVGRMYTDLAAQLTGSPPGMAIAPAPAERLVRLVSIAGGYLALAAAYAGVIRLMLH